MHWHFTSVAIKFANFKLDVNFCKFLQRCNWFLLCGWGAILFCFFFLLVRCQRFDKKSIQSSPPDLFLGRTQKTKKPHHRIGRKEAGMEHIKGRAMCYNMKAADALHEKFKVLFGRRWTIHWMQLAWISHWNIHRVKFCREQSPLSSCYWQSKKSTLINGLNELFLSIRHSAFLIRQFFSESFLLLPYVYGSTLSSASCITGRITPIRPLAVNNLTLR